MTLLCLVKRDGWVFEEPIEPAGEVALEASAGFAGCLAFADSALGLAAVTAHYERAPPSTTASRSRSSQARLGRTSASETLDTYAHLWPDNEERTRAAVDDVLGRRTGT